MQLFSILIVDHHVFVCHTCIIASCSQQRDHVAHQMSAVLILSQSGTHSPHGSIISGSEEVLISCHWLLYLMLLFFNGIICSCKTVVTLVWSYTATVALWCTAAVHFSGIKATVLGSICPAEVSFSKTVNSFMPPQVLIHNWLGPLTCSLERKENYLASIKYSFSISYSLLSLSQKVWVAASPR